MKDLIIVGAGGFGREVAWLVERINSINPTWNLLGFLDDDENIWGQERDGYPVLGGCGKAAEYKDAAFVCSVGASRIRKIVIEKLKSFNPEIEFATLIDPSVLMSDRVEIGEGSIICAGTIITVDIKLGEHTIINLDCTVGHDVVFEDYVTLYPSVNVSGNVVLKAGVEMGTGCAIIQGKKVGKNTIVGAGAVVIRDMDADCTVVGNPAKVVKRDGELVRNPARVVKRDGELVRKNDESVNELENKEPLVNSNRRPVEG